MNKALLASLLLGTLFGGCASGPGHRYDASNAKMAEALAGVRAIGDQLKAKQQAIADRVLADKPRVERMFAEIRRLNKHNHSTAPKSLEYEMIMSGANDRMDRIADEIAETRYRAASDARTDDMEREIERGQIESRRPQFY